jgi:hypothetical protein
MVAQLVTRRLRCSYIPDDGRSVIALAVTRGGTTAGDVDALVDRFGCRSEAKYEASEEDEPQHVVRACADHLGHLLCDWRWSVRPVWDVERGKVAISIVNTDGISREGFRPPTLLASLTCPPHPMIDLGDNPTREQLAAGGFVAINNEYRKALAAFTPDTTVGIARDCPACGVELHYSARVGTGLCGPCHRKATGFATKADRLRARYVVARPDPAAVTWTAMTPATADMPGQHVTTTGDAARTPVVGDLVRWWPNYAEQDHYADATVIAMSDGRILALQIEGRTGPRWSSIHGLIGQVVDLCSLRVTSAYQLLHRARPGRYASDPVVLTDAGLSLALHSSQPVEALVDELRIVAPAHSAALAFLRDCRDSRRLLSVSGREGRYAITALALESDRWTPEATLTLVLRRIFFAPCPLASGDPACGAATPRGLCDALLALSGVEAACVVERDGHGEIEVFVDGGDTLAIARCLLDNTWPGVVLCGTKRFEDSHIAFSRGAAQALREGPGLRSVGGWR